MKDVWEREDSGESPKNEIKNDKETRDGTPVWSECVLLHHVLQSNQILHVHRTIVSGVRRNRVKGATQHEGRSVSNF